MTIQLCISWWKKTLIIQSTSSFPEQQSGIFLKLFCAMTNICAINSQNITLLHISILSCHLQGVCVQCLAKSHKYFKCSCWFLNTIFCIWNTCRSCIMRYWKDRRGEAPILRRIEKSRSGWLFSCANWWNDRIDGNTKKSLYLYGKTGIGKCTCVVVLVFWIWYFAFEILA